MGTIKGIPLKLQVILCTFIEAKLQELEQKRCKLLKIDYLREYGLKMQFKMQDMMSWAWREDVALWALFKLLGSQIHNLG